MKELHTQMDKHGRLLIPSQIRNSLNYKPGDTFVIRVSADDLHIVSLAKVIKEAQHLLKKYNIQSGSMVDEFLEQKHFESEIENKKYIK